MSRLLIYIELSDIEHSQLKIEDS